MESRRKLPLNFSNEDSELFSHEIVRKIPESYLLELKWQVIDSNIRFYKTILSNEYILNNNLEVIQYSYISYVKFLLGRILKKDTVFYRFPLCIISDNWSYGYYHWVHDVLPRILSIKDLVIEHGVILPYFYKDYPYISESLKLLGIYKIFYLENKKFYWFKTLYFPTHIAPTGNYNDVLTRRLRKILLNKADCPVPAFRKVYLSRSKATRRRIINEDIVTSFLENFGFETLYCEEMTFSEQLNLFSETKFLISNHGAGLSNMIFMKDNSRVFEFRAKGDKLNNCYFALASALNIDYFYQNCSKVVEEESTHTADIKIDMASFDVNIKLFLS